MQPVVLLALCAACCGGAAGAPAAPDSAAPAAAASASAGAPVPIALPPAPAPAQPVATAATPAGVPAAPQLAVPGAASSVGSLLQTILALGFVLLLVVALAWLMKRYGPKPVGGSARLRLLSTLSLGGRERIMLIEVADQWIVVGASPGRVNALATLPRQPDEEAVAGAPNGPAAANFSEWLKQTIDKRNGK